MAGSRAAHRYAKALLSLASEKNQLQEVDEDMRLIHQTIKDSKDLRLLLKSPIIKSDLKLSSLKEIFKEVSAQSKQLFEVLIANKRINLLPQVVQAFIALVNKMNNVTTAEVITAIPLTGELEKKVLRKIKELTGNEATLKKKVDKELLGGFLLRIGDLQYDASISGKLNNLKHTLKQNTQI